MISLQNIEKSFSNQTTSSQKILNGISLHVSENEFVTLKGPSGCGKSTLLHLIGALDKPDSGKIHVNGIDLANADAKTLSEFRNRDIGIVFQFFHLFPRLSVRENILLPAQIAQKINKQTLDRCEQLLIQIGLLNHANQPTQTLSGGEMQRVCLARALINKPRILLADEPTGSLDSQNGKMVLELFQKLHHEESLTIFLITHDEQIHKIGTRRLHMLDGKIQGAQ